MRYLIIFLFFTQYSYAEDIFVVRCDDEVKSTYQKFEINIKDKILIIHPELDGLRSSIPIFSIDKYKIIAKDKDLQFEFNRLDGTMTRYYLNSLGSIDHKRKSRFMPVCKKISFKF